MNKSSLQIGKKSFLTSVAIIAVLMILAGVLTHIIPTGAYERVFEDGREVVVPNSFEFTDSEPLPFWRVLTAPVEVLWSEDAATVIVIIAFIIIIGGIFMLLEKSGILQYILSMLVTKFGKNKYRLLCVVSFAFMIFGSAFGLFEELVVLVPISIALAYSLGWDTLVGLGMSVLSACFGFSAVTFNPFTLGVAQGLAGLPLFSGLLFRIPVLILTYIILITFLMRYAKKIEKTPEKSLVYSDDAHLREKYGENAVKIEIRNEQHVKRAMRTFYIMLVLLCVVAILGILVPAVGSVMLPLIIVVFLCGSLISAKKTHYTKSIGRDFIGGMAGTAPGAVLILMAMSVKLIIASGGVMDTILYYAADAIQGTSPYVAAILIYLLVLVLNFFIGSGSAKAFLVMPLIAPLTDLIGVSRQTAVEAFVLGDGITNMLYPTNALLMITLGLSVVSYPKWFKWTIKLQLAYVVFSVAVVAVAVLVGLGPF